MYYLYKIGRFIALIFPLKIGYAVAVFLAKLYYFFSVKDKAALIENIKTVIKNKENASTVLPYQIGKSP